MNKYLLSIYYKLPYFLKSTAASLYGYYLRSQRYPRDTDSLVKEAIAREKWSAEQWRIYQERKLAQILERAVTKVPYYRTYWERQQEKGNYRSWKSLENWPILTKEELRRNPKAFLAEDCRMREMHCEHTSGTTGTPLNLWWSKKTTAEWGALNDARTRLWNGVSRNDRWAIFGGRTIISSHQTSPPFWVWNAGLKQLYLSSYHISAQSARYYLEAIKKYKIVYLLGYPSSMYSLALFGLEQKLDFPTLKVAISNSEPLFDYQREIISKAFRCPVQNTYGMSEVVAAGSECENGNLHIWPEVGIIEVFDDEKDIPLPKGKIGRLICTGLLNTDMLLIRYEVGDRGALAPDSQKCSCGRTLPLLLNIEGRNDDIIITPDGRRIGRLDPVFKSDLKIREAQIIQESLTKVRVRFVPASDYRPANDKEIINQLKARLGDMNIILEPVSFIERTSRGKFQAVVSLLKDKNF